MGAAKNSGPRFSKALLYVLRRGQAFQEERSCEILALDDQGVPPLSSGAHFVSDYFFKPPLLARREPASLQACYT